MLGNQVVPLEPVGRPMEILLVEDSLVAAKLTLHALEQYGILHRLTWISHGREARSFLLQEGEYSRAPRPDLILLDLLLPEIDGLSLLRELRAQPALKQVPVVIMTSTMDEQQRTEFVELDVKGMLIKPVDYAQFLALMESVEESWKSGMIVLREE